MDLIFYFPKPVFIIFLNLLNYGSIIMRDVIFDILKITNNVCYFLNVKKKIFTVSSKAFYYYGCKASIKIIAILKQSL